MHQQARTGVADLAGVVINAAHSAVHGSVQVVQVGQKNLRAFATRLQRHALHVGLPGITQQQLAHGGGTGERELDHIGVQSQRFASLGPQAVDHIEHPGRASRFYKQLRQLGATQRRLLGRLEYHAVARSQNRCHLPDRHQHGVVPRRDGGHHPHGLVQDEVQGFGRGVRHGAFNFVDALGKVANGFGDFWQVDVQHIADGFAHVQRLQQGQLVGVLLNQVGKLEKNLHARSRCQTAPSPVVPGPQATGHGGVYVGGLAFGHFCNQRAIGWVDAVKRGPVLRRHITPVQKQTGGNVQVFGFFKPVLVTQ